MPGLEGQGSQHCSHQPSWQSSTFVASHGALALLRETWVFPFWQDREAGGCEAKYIKCAQKREMQPKAAMRKTALWRSAPMALTRQLDSHALVDFRASGSFLQLERAPE